MLGVGTFSEYVMIPIFLYNENNATSNLQFFNTISDKELFPKHSYQTPLITL